MNNWLVFKEQQVAASRKSKIWHVKNSKTGAHLGQVRWVHAWDQYGFYAEETVWNPESLNELDEFLKIATDVRKEAVAASD